MVTRRRRAGRTAATRGERLWIVGLVLVGAVAGSSCRGAKPATVRAGVDPGARARAAASYERWRRPERVIEAIGVVRGARVADVGAGRGYLTFRLAQAAGVDGRVVATDVSFGELWQLVGVGAARSEAVARAQAPVDVRLVGRDDPGLEENTYDRIVVAEVDHLLPDRAAYFRRLARSLRPGGAIAVENRFPYHDAVVAAARAAGLSVREPAIDLPGQFVVILEVPK